MSPVSIIKVIFLQPKICNPLGIFTPIKLVSERQFWRRASILNRLKRKLLAQKACLALFTAFFGHAVSSEGDKNSPQHPQLLSYETLRSEKFIPDFSYAGYQNGEQRLPVAEGVVIDVAKFGALANDGQDDSAAIQRAFDAANKIEQPVIIRFEAGTYRITSVLRINRSDFVLQGQGAGAMGTELHFPRPLRHVDKSPSLDELRTYIRRLNKRQKEPDLNINEYFSEYSWSGGFIWIQAPDTRPAPYLEELDPSIEVLSTITSGVRGEDQFTVVDSSAIKAGQIIQLQWLNRAGQGSGILKAIYGENHALAGSHHWTFKERPLVRQTVRVRSIEGNRVTIADALLHDINNTVPAQAASWIGLVNIGIEDMHLSFPESPTFGHHLEEGYNGIYFTSAFDSWARNLKVTNADSALLSYNSANLTFENIVTDGTRTAHYAVHMGNVHNVIAKDLRVLNRVRHSLTFNTQSTKCVYQKAEVFVAPVLDQHAGANHQNLFDAVTLHAPVREQDGKKTIAIYDGSGAGYWQPGHGGYNTTWNLKILVSGGAHPGDKVALEGVDEGPMAIIVGIHGNREFELDYRPKPLISIVNTQVAEIPSLYDHQLSERMKASASVLSNSE